MFAYLTSNRYICSVQELNFNVMERIRRAAIYYLRHQGMAGTGKQVERLMNQFSGHQIIRMAEERGYKDGTSN